jgi:hypothetical protein
MKTIPITMLGDRTATPGTGPAAPPLTLALFACRTAAQELRAGYAAAPAVAAILLADLLAEQERVVTRLEELSVSLAREAQGGGR